MAQQTLMAILMAVAVLAAGSDAKSQNCICTMEYNPVCGQDGTTYSNACGARCNGVAVLHAGSCIENSCICAEIYSPVCGTDGKTYGNECEAGCAGVQVLTGGVCMRPPTHSCICPLIWFPVCGSDGKVYGNGCQASCAGVTFTVDSCPAE